SPERSMAMVPDCLFREDSYLKECSATVVGMTPAGGVILDRTVFYAASGGQPADRGVLRRATGEAVLIAGASFTDAEKSQISHQPAAAGLALTEGETVHAAIDWDLRLARLRLLPPPPLLSPLLPHPTS